MAKGILLKILPINPESRQIYSGLKSTQHKGDSGFDLYIINDQTIKGNSTDYIGLGIKAAAYKFQELEDSITNENVSQGNTDPDSKTFFDVKYKILRNVSWLLMPRSSISKTPLRMANSIGLIDSGYRGEVKIAVDNTQSEPYTIHKGERLVQAVAFNGNPITFELVDALDDTSRGSGGFGSTDLVKTDVFEKDPKKPKIDIQNLE